VKSYEPTGTGESPLANIKSFTDVYGFINKDGEFESYKGKVTKEILKKGKIKLFKRETNTMPQWAGSSWYWLRYMDPKNKKALVDKKVEKYWGQVDVYLGGMEHATRHLIYGRFWNRFLYDKKIISTKEPFNRLEAVGLVLGEGGVKMSKRLGNVINPDDIVKQFGADTLRLYIAFAASYHDSFAWDTKAIVGPRRFIEKVWALQYKTTKKRNENKKIETLLHQTIKKVGEDYEKLSFNTAISQMMIFVNNIEEEIDIEFYKILLKLLEWYNFCAFVQTTHSKLF
jgi:leucyl-tRNA synthetase